MTSQISRDVYREINELVVSVGFTGDRSQELFEMSWEELHGVFVGRERQLQSLDRKIDAWPVDDPVIGKVKEVWTRFRSCFSEPGDHSDKVFSTFFKLGVYGSILQEKYSVTNEEVIIKPDALCDQVPAPQFFDDYHRLYTTGVLLSGDWASSCETITAFSEKLERIVIKDPSVVALTSKIQSTWKALVSQFSAERPDGRFVAEIALRLHNTIEEYIAQFHFVCTEPTPCDGAGGSR